MTFSGRRTLVFLAFGACATFAVILSVFGLSRDPAVAFAVTPCWPSCSSPEITETATSTSTATATETPTLTPTETATATPTVTQTATSAPTDVVVPTSTATAYVPEPTATTMYESDLPTDEPISGEPAAPVAPDRESPIILPDGSINPDGFRSNQMIIRVAEKADPAAVAARWGVDVLGWIPEIRLALIGLRDIPDTRIMLDPVSLDPDIEIVEINSIHQAPEARAAVNFSAEALSGMDPDYAFSLIGMTQASCVDGSGIIVAVIDTGIDVNHPEFAGKLSADAWNVIDNTSDVTETQNGHDDDNDGTIDEMYGHGTHVAGIVSRVAPGATILPIKALNDDGIGDAFGLATAIVYAYEHGARVINLSLSSATEAQSVELAIKAAESKGVIVVAATGNENVETPKQYPAASEGVIGVSATGPDDLKSGFSNYGEEISMSAPGTEIESAIPGGGYAAASGTSMAAPFVAGGIALLMQHDPSLDASDIAAIVERASTPIDLLNPDYAGKLGSGRLDIDSAVDCSG